MINDKRIPVTILTGFLGAGKTTLLNRILSEKHGQRIAVIENEFGEVGIDHELVIGADEEVFEMSNGCICCTVRGDLIRVLGNLMKRRDKFDYVLIETTGLADPGPVAQTFFVDPEITEAYQLDAIVTVVDAHHHRRHMAETKEAAEQVAFADVIVLNKADLATEDELSQLERDIVRSNPVARILRAKNAQVDVSRLLNVGGFNVDRALEVNPAFMRPEYPFEWRGVVAVPPGEVRLVLEKGPDPRMKIAVLPWREGEGTPFGALDEKAMRLFSESATKVSPGEPVKVEEAPMLLELNGSPAEFPFLRKGVAVSYAVYTEHGMEEYKGRLENAEGPLAWTGRMTYRSHEHDDQITSVGIETAGELHPKKLNKWLQTILAEKGADIFRMKGVLSLQDEPRRFVFQGVHMLFDGKPGRPWGAEPRKNSLVFIGRKLDRQSLTKAFESCLV